jgi:hypothetical protein
LPYFDELLYYSNQLKQFRTGVAPWKQLKNFN